jgi:hypothetical protein
VLGGGKYRRGKGCVNHFAQLDLEMLADVLSEFSRHSLGDWISL